MASVDEAIADLFPACKLPVVPSAIADQVPSFSLSHNFDVLEQGLPEFAKHTSIGLFQPFRHEGQTNAQVLVNVSLAEYGFNSNSTPQTIENGPMSTNDVECSLGSHQAEPKAEMGSVHSKSRKKAMPWTAEEHALFLVGLERFYKDGPVIGRNGAPSVGLGLGIAELISALVGTRTPKQVRSHAQKYFMRRQIKEL